MSAPQIEVLDWSHHVDSTKLPCRSIFMKVELLLTHFLMGTNHPPVCEETTGTLQTLGTFSWSESSLCVPLLVWGGSHGLDWCLQSWALISGWVVRLRGRIRVTEGVRLKVRLGLDPECLGGCVREHLLDLVKSAVWHRPPVSQDSKWRWWRFP